MLNSNFFDTSPSSDADAAPAQPAAEFEPPTKEEPSSEIESPSPAETEAPDDSDAPAAEPSIEPSDEPSPAPSASLRLENGDITLGRGERVRGALRPVIEGNAQGAVSYSSSDPKIVRVDAASGELYGAKIGSATITASLPDGASASCSVSVRKAPSKFKLKLERSTLGAGESAALQISFNSGAHSCARNLKSSDEAVARVEGERVVAVAPGKATLSGKTFNGKKAKIQLTVKPAPTSLDFPAPVAPLGVGERAPLAASVNEGAAGAVRYALQSGAEFASLEDKLLTAVAPGEVVVRAETYNGVAAEQHFTIIPAPEIVQLSEAELTLGLNEKLEGALHAAPGEGSAGSLRFVSSKPSVVKVDPQTGALRAKKKGTAYVRAIAYNGVESAPCKVVVRPAPKKVKLALPLKACSVGQAQIAEVKLVGGEGHWSISSGDPSVIEVRGASQLVALKPGKSKITAKSYNGKKSSAVITVVAAPEVVLPERESVDLVEGLPERVGFLTPGSFATFRYESSAPEIAAVEPNGDGTVTPLREGEAIITAVSHNGLTASTLVRVHPCAQALAIDEAEITLCVGERAPLAFHTLPEGSLVKYSYASSNRSVVTVDESGQISGMKAGSAVVSVGGHNGISAQAQVRVIDYRERHKAVAIAHRGASERFRENTPEAFRCAAELGAEWIETDVRLTADGEIVLYHDGYIRAGKKQKHVSTLTLAELKAIDPRIVTLDEGLDCLSALPVHLLVEFKSYGADFERRVVEAIRARDMMERTAFDSFDWACVERIKSAFPAADVVLVVDTSKQLKSILQHPEKYAFASGVTVRHTLLTATNVRDLHLLGLNVTCWTLKRPKGIARLVKIGVDGIMVNDPGWM